MRPLAQRHCSAICRRIRVTDLASQMKTQKISMERYGRKVGSKRCAQQTNMGPMDGSAMHRHRSITDSSQIDRPTDRARDMLRVTKFLGSRSIADRARSIPARDDTNFSFATHNVYRNPGAGAPETAGS